MSAMYRATIKFILVGFVLFVSALHATNVPCRDLHGNSLDQLTLLPPGPAAKKALEKIIATFEGRPVPEIGISAADIPSAAAVICDDEPVRRVLYSESYFALLEEGGLSSWARLSILAHEVGHHLENHPLLWQYKDFQALELAADEFTGAAICQLGGSVKDAHLGIDYLEGRSDPRYPKPGTRREVITQAYLQAKNAGICPPPPPTPECFEELSPPITIDADTVLLLAREERIVASSITFAQGIDFVVDHPLILFAKSLTFRGGASLQGSDLTIVARDIEGGTIRADGHEGEPGGRIVILADSIAGTLLSARGGDGKDGTHGDPGKNGKNGYHGRDAQCEPGNSRESTPGEDGLPGLAGGDGESGSPGGDGGTIILVSREDKQVYKSVEGGFGGHGGNGGRGGRGGFPGRSGHGCSSSEVTHPSSPSRSPGPPGPSGIDAPDGRPGKKGIVETPRKLHSAGEICQIYEGSQRDLSQIAAEVRRAQVHR